MSTSSVKRFYVEGLEKLDSKCPHCGTMVGLHDYLSYPPQNEDFEYTYCCQECDQEHSRVLHLKVSIGFGKEGES